MTYNPIAVRYRIRLQSNDITSNWVENNSMILEKVEMTRLLDSRDYFIKSLFIWSALFNALLNIEIFPFWRQLVLLIVFLIAVKMLCFLKRISS